MPTPVEVTVRNVIMKELSLDTIEPLADHAKLRELYPQFDSLDSIELCMSLELAFDIDINDDLWEKHDTTVGSVVKLIKHLKLGHEL